MNANRKKSHQPFKTDWAKFDAHVIQPEEYEEIPELTNEDIARAVIKRAGRPICTNPRVQVTIRVPELILRLWKSSGPGWQTRMTDLLIKHAP
jgi:uncharacterized protein (DUF4415 family)